MDRKFTEYASNALMQAQMTAENLGHTYIGSEHILAGILSQRECAAAILLAKSNITYEDVVDKIKEVFTSGAKTELSPADMTARTRALLRSAAYECEKTGSELIGTEHLLFAILLMQD